MNDGFKRWKRGISSPHGIKVVRHHCFLRPKRTNKTFLIQNGMKSSVLLIALVPRIYLAVKGVVKLDGRAVRGVGSRVEVDAVQAVRDADRGVGTAWSGREREERELSVTLA